MILRPSELDTQSLSEMFSIQNSSRVFHMSYIKGNCHDYFALKIVQVSYFDRKTSREVMVYLV